MRNLLSVVRQWFLLLMTFWNRDPAGCKSYCGRCVTTQDLEELERRIMSAISTFAEQQAARLGRIEAAITGVAGDIATLNDLITQLQNSAGSITPEDQALLDALQTRGEEIATRLEALDAQTPPPAGA